MKVLILGGTEVQPVARVLDQLTDRDKLIVTGATHRLVEILLKRKKVRERPQLDVRLLETHLDRERAIERLAMALANEPELSVIVFAGDPNPELQERVMHFAALREPPVPVVDAADFVAERQAV